MRSFLAASLLVAFVLASSSASAVALNPRGIGGVLLFPYYTVNRGQDTLVSLVNTADTAKVARVRFLEGYNGRTVFETYVFLSAHDVWSAAITQVADDGGAKLVSNDRTCTYPALTPEREAFVSSDYDGVALHSGDTGPTSITRTREGSIEIIEAADIVPGSMAEAAITHAQNGTPGGAPPCHFAGGPGSQPVPIADLAPPTGGLYGSASIINVADGTFVAYDATALVDFTDRVLVTDFHAPGEATLADAHSSDSNRTARAYLADDRGVLAVDFDEGIDAVTALFMQETLSNDLVTTASLGANTDWVVGFPTKRFYVDERLQQYARAPFLEMFGEHVVEYDNSRIRGVSRVGIEAYIYDREERMTTTRDQEYCGYPCPVQQPIFLSYQTNVIAFGADGTASNTPSRVLGSVLSLYYRAGYGQPARPDAGWMLLDLTTLDPFGLNNGVNAAGETVYVFGMPAIGFMAYNIVNANAQPGVLGNYGGAFAHRGTTCRNTDGTVCFVPPPLPN